MGTWTNSDGLYIKYGTTEAVVRQGGALSTTDGLNTLLFNVDWENLQAAGTVTYLSDSLAIPKGAWLKSAVFYVDEAFDSVGDNMTLTFGTYRQGDRTTAIDADGIDATIAQGAIDALGDTITCDGADINTVIDATYDALVTATVGTSTATAGRGRLVIQYYIPYTPQD